MTRDEYMKRLSMAVEQYSDGLTCDYECFSYVLDLSFQAAKEETFKEAIENAHKEYEERLASVTF
jgi:hypothetical protein